MKKAVVFMLFGQSNAVGHAMPMSEEDIIKEPLRNVFGLSREKNQSFDIDSLQFSGYTSFGMNLAEEQDNTYSVANQLARMWQEKIDNEKMDLPDLYIIHMAIGSQGVYGMWHPDRERQLIPGKLGTVQISLYPFTIHILTLLKKYFEENKIEPEYMGIHWRGGEQETDYNISELKDGKLESVYLRIFGGMREAIGVEAPIVLHKLPFFEIMLKTDPTGEKLRSLEFINALFAKLEREYPNTTTFDPLRAPHHDPYVWDKNLYRWDLIHYTGKTNTWVASDILKTYLDSKKF